MTAAPVRSELGSQRALFEIPDDVTYLNCASMSPQLRTVTAAGIDAVRAKASPWKLCSDDWFVHAEPLRALFARVVGADAESVAIIPSVSYGLAIAAANVQVRAGQSIVVLEREFPSGTYTWRELARRTGARVVTVMRERGASWTDALVAALDENVALVAAPACHWTDGSLVDLERLAPAVRAVGAALVIDASQAAGAHPIDVATIQPDFLCSVGYKWQLGPYSLGYLYAAPKYHERGVPIEQSWMSRAGAEDFTSLVDYVDELRPGARRFDMGEFSQFTLLPMSVAGLTQVLEWGVPRIAAGIGVLTSRIASEAAALGCHVPPDADRVKHIVGVKLPHGPPSGLTERLAESRTFVSIRGDSIRVAPHLYNDERDVERFIEVLRRALD